MKHYRLDALVVLLAGFLLSGCAGTGETDVVTIDFETDEGTSLSFDLSPDGRTIVFDLLGQLWTLPADGGAATPLTNAVRDTAEDREPAFSPDGRSIVFRADRSGGSGVFVLSLEDLSLTRLTRATFPGDATPVWSPGGDRIVFVRRSPTFRHTFLVVDVADTTPRSIRIDGLPGAAPVVSDPMWSPDGSRLVFVNASLPPSIIRRVGGRVWEVSADGGEARPLTTADVRATAPTWAPDGQRLAFFAPDSANAHQLWVLEPGGQPVKLTDQRDVSPSRVRWFPDESRLLYHADGRLWTIPPGGGPPREIPFTAHVRFDRHAPSLRPVRFPEPGVETTARGHAGAALAPGGTRVAMIALSRLWVIGPGGQPRSVASLPSSAAWPAWSPDESEVAWSAGPWGEEDLYATDVSTGRTRQLTSLPGAEERPSWSPDGRYIAFNHQPTDWGRDPIRIRVIPARAPTVASPDSTTDVGPGFITYSLSQDGDNPISWSPDSAPRIVNTTFGSIVRASVTDSIRESSYPERHAPTFMSWSDPQTLIWIESNRLWSAAFDFETGEIGEAVPISDDAAGYASVSRDGSILYVSGDGLRIRRTDGSVESIGWPLTYTPPVPAPLIVRNVHLVAPDAPETPVDIVIENGRITDIAPTGTVPAPDGTRLLDAGGRFVIPGLIDLHQHTFEEGMLAGALYHGVTTIRDMGSSGIAWIADQRDGVAAGVRPGPRIVLGGVQFLGPVPGHYTGLGGQLLSDDATTDRALALLSAFDVDYVKMRMFNGWHEATHLVTAAHDHGWRLSGHVTSPLPLIAAGLDGGEHLGSAGDRTDGILYDDMFQLYRAAGMWFVPTISVVTPYDYKAGDPWAADDPEKGPFMALTWRTTTQPRPTQPDQLENGRRIARIARTATRKAHEAGIAIAAGTDVRPWSMHGELEQLVAAGLSPMESITAATGTAARVLGAADEIGTIEVGKWADLVILNADPLDDIRNTRDIWMVIKGGDEVDRDALLGWVYATPVVASPASAGSGS